MRILKLRLKQFMISLWRHSCKKDIGVLAGGHFCGGPAKEKPGHIPQPAEGYLKVISQ